MHRNLTRHLLVLCALVFGAIGIAGAQRSTTPDGYAFPSAIGQDLKSGQNKNGKGSISGRVIKEDGQPVPGMVVFAYYGRRGAHPNMSVQTSGIVTDKEGSFLIADLLPGEYILSTLRPCCEESNRDSIRQREAQESPYYQTELVYYKDTLDRKDAESVWVRANEETAGVEIFIRNRILHKVSGTVFNRDGTPLPGAKLMITRKQTPDTGPHAGGITTAANERGDWSFDVPDGVYIIEVWNAIAKEGEKSGPGLPTIMGPTLVGNDAGQPRQVTVSGSDLPGVKMDMNRRAQILSGRVVLENGAAIPPEVLIDLGINEAFEIQGLPPDGSFKLKGLKLGKQFLSVIVQPFGTYYVKSISWNGADYMTEPFEFGNGVDYEGVEVVLAAQGALLEGSLGVNGRASAVASGQVWLIPQDEAKWRAPLTWFFSQIYDGRTFTMYAAPGDYLIIIDARGGLKSGPYDLDTSEDYIRAHASAARRITLKGGERKSVEF